MTTWNESDSQVDDILDLFAGHFQSLVDLSLVHLIDFGDREESKISQDDQSQAIEPGANVCQAPE